MLTIREVQQRTGLSYPAVKQRIDDGTVRTTKQGKKYLINEEDLHLLPKPRQTGMQQARAETVEVPQGASFSIGRYPEEITLKTLENERIMLDIMQQNRAAMISMR